MTDRAEMPIVAVLGNDHNRFPCGYEAAVGRSLVRKSDAEAALAAQEKQILALTAQGEPVAWQERQARRLNRATGEVIEWSPWYECRPRRHNDPLTHTSPYDMITREWRPLFASLEKK